VRDVDFVAIGRIVHHHCSSYFFHMNDINKNTVLFFFILVLPCNSISYEL